MYQHWVCLLAAASALAHNVGSSTRGDIGRRQLAANERHVLARRCSREIAAHHRKRMAKRSPTGTVTALGPHFTEIQNFTCVTAPETTEGPFYVNNEYVRRNLVEGQEGVKMLLDIGVLDTTTCEPLSAAFVELWSTNATGFYGAFEEVALPDFTSIPMTSKNTFLRGGYPTDLQGMVEFTTLYPGFYPGRTPHIHLMIHTNWTAASNGTFLSHSGVVRHVGQLFFEEEWNDAVFGLPTYAGNTNKRTLNKDDYWYDEENADGNNAQVQLQLLKEDISNGLLGYITVGVNSSATYEIDSDNYYELDSSLVIENH